MEIHLGVFYFMNELKVYNLIYRLVQQIINL
jgi:hypothetical protein